MRLCALTRAHADGVNHRVLDVVAPKPDNRDEPPRAQEVPTEATGGDVFVMLPPDDRYLFGRVVSVDANPLGVGGAVLIYVYAPRSKDKQTIPDLSPGHLLVAPIMTNRLPWSRGYFECVEHRVLSSNDTLKVHCFERSWTNPKQYFNEHGARLPGPVEPVGSWGLDSFRTIDDKISAALGIPRAPDEKA